MGLPFKSVVREVRDSIRTKSRGRVNRRGRAHIAPEGGSDLPSQWGMGGDQGPWANLPPELLRDIIQRIESRETSWPSRRDVVVCAAVCQSWRRITKEIVKTPEQCSFITFPISLKQPGPRDAPIQCFIKRERATSTFQLYLGLSPALSGCASKLLLAAKKVRKATSSEFRISFVGTDFSQDSNTFVGKMRSNFLGTKFTILDSQPSNPEMQKVNSVEVSSYPPARGFSIATIVYELNVLRTRGPRRMRCTMLSIPISSVQEGGTAPTPTELMNYCNDRLPSSPTSKGKMSDKNDLSSRNLSEPPVEALSREPLVLKNKAPRWHEQLQCWCLNFKGRVTVASVKNFQLAAAAEPCQNVSPEEQEKVILQFGKIGKDIFTMDYRYPLSAFQAFAICLSSFDTKPACE
ncbi:Tubby-like F-box protein 6 [Linum grandiflorum]